MTPLTRRVSVCMASYHGAAFIEEQVASILEQLGDDDELVVVDDASRDETVEILRRIGDDRVRVVVLPANRGHIAAFETALAQARGRYLMLADQDDLWPAGRVDLMVEALQDAHFVAGNQQEFPTPRAVRPASLRPEMGATPSRNVLNLMLGRQPYFGCAMGMRREFRDLALPFPSHVEAHDHWLSLLANVAGPFPHLGEAVVLRRVHGSNQTPGRRRPLPQVLRSRLWLLLNLARAWRRVRSADPQPSLVPGVRGEDEPDRSA